MRDEERRPPPGVLEQGWRTKGGRTYHNDPGCEWLQKGQNRLRLIGKDTHEVVPVRWADVGPGQLQPCDHCCAPAWLERHGRAQVSEKPCLVMSDDRWWEGTLIWESSRRPDGLWWATVTYRKQGQMVTEVRSQHDIRAR
ncbi:hypothetical protein C8D88_11611 [Lentzea atacamensis]|uniref:Uncharacterized protein n=1 Tax=Lentzea atacamensis TaxID=531938 RepID=A0A316HK40_9PSEU|nr:hypothetical protein [Lentzea atacamensis]PWK81601.1 hypothetical protein C8D88_11611 [Lentzea atacamensis]